MGRQVNTWKLWWLNSLICENYSFLLQGPEMLLMPNISSALFLWHPRVEAFSPLNWSCLLCGKGGVWRYFVCPVSEDLGSRTSLDPAEQRNLLSACPWSGRNGCDDSEQPLLIQLQWVNTALRGSHDSQIDSDSLKELTSMWQRVI